MFYLEIFLVFVCVEQQRSSHLRRFGYYFLKYPFSIPLSSGTPKVCMWICSMVSQISRIYFLIFSSFLIFWSSAQIISINLPSSSLNLPLFRTHCISFIVLFNSRISVWFIFKICIISIFSIGKILFRYFPLVLQT